RRVLFRSNVFIRQGVLHTHYELRVEVPDLIFAGLPLDSNLMHSPSVIRISLQNRPFVVGRVGIFNHSDFGSVNITHIFTGVSPSTTFSVFPEREEGHLVGQFHNARAVTSPIETDIPIKVPAPYRRAS